MLVKFEQNLVVRTIHKFEPFDKKWLTTSVSPELCSVIVSPELSSVRDYMYVITHSVRSMYCLYVYVVCMLYFAKLIAVSTYIDVLVPWDLDTMILG